MTGIKNNHSRNSNDFFEEQYQKLHERYKDYKDPWGLSIKTCQKALKALYPIYKGYFKTRFFGKENITDKSYIVTSNHSGQIPIDALLVGTAFAIESPYPKIVRPMVERFLAKLPFLGEVTAKVGGILGDRKNASYLLSRGESLLVFPEGVRGISKGTKDFYKLQPFPSGFVKIAAQTQTPILPIAVIGAEEFYPYVYNAKFIAKIFGLPSLPLTPFMPLLGPLAAVPLPSPVDIYVGEEIAPPRSEHFDEIQRVKNKVENKIKHMIEQGLKNRRPANMTLNNTMNKTVQNLIEKYDKL